MSDLLEPASGRAAELRRAFDQSFAAPPNPRTEEVEDLLAVGVRGDAYAFRVREIVHVAKVDRVTPLPSSDPELLGLAGIRGMLVPVYSLAGVLGYGSGREAPRWLAIVGPGDPLALALGEFEGYLRLPRKDFQGPDREARRHVAQFVRTGSMVRGVIDVASVVSRVRTRAALPSKDGRR